MIKLSKKWDYALKSIIYIAEKSPELLKIQDVSNDLNISESLLRRIIADFHKLWIIESVKWRNGWVKLLKEKKDISVYEILFSVGEELWITDCTKWLECVNIDKCWTTNLLSNLQKSFNWILKLQTLDKIIKK